MVVNERTMHCMNVVVWSGVSSRGGDGGDGWHLRESGGLWRERRERERDAGATGIGAAQDQALIEVNVGRQWQNLCIPNY